MCLCAIRGQKRDRVPGGGEGGVCGSPGLPSDARVRMLMTGDCAVSVVNTGFSAAPAPYFV